MTATDELRRMLDERGVEWCDGGEGLTIIPAQDGVPRAWTVNTWPSGKDMGDCLWVQNRHPLTPEQAIAATLGNADLTAENAKLRELVKEAHLCMVNEGCCEDCYATHGECPIERDMRELGIEVDE